MTLMLKNPHSISAALAVRPQDVIEICPPPSGSQAWEAALHTAQQAGVPLVSPRRQPKQRGRGGDGKSGRESAGYARVKPVPSRSLSELLADAPQRDNGRGLWLALDCLQDPHNLGAILRTAAFFGAQGMILPSDRSAPLSAVACDVAAGGAEHVPHAVEVNLARALDEVKEAGVWILGTSEHAKDTYADVPNDRPWLLVIGNEATGLRRLTLERCDQICAIPPRGAVASLNASVAAAITIAHLTSGPRSA
jgi:23S rRNA (guanosine2251-2'-O)-methyltransferase